MPTPTNLRFDVLRDGSCIGQHEIWFRQEGATLSANIALSLVVRLGPIPLYRYAHKARETWQDGAFLSFESETNDNGTRHQFQAVRTTESVVAKSAAGVRQVFASEAIPFTHWNELCMRRPLFNPQDGVPITAGVESRGEEMIRLANGRKVAATRYAVLLKPVLEDWYDGDGRWTALRTKAFDGSLIEYRRR